MKWSQIVELLEGEVMKGESEKAEKENFQKRCPVSELKSGAWIGPAEICNPVKTTLCFDSLAVELCCRSQIFPLSYLCLSCSLPRFVGWWLSFHWEILRVVAIPWEVGPQSPLNPLPQLDDVWSIPLMFRCPQIEMSRLMLNPWGYSLISRAYVGFGKVLHGKCGEME